MANVPTMQQLLEAGVHFGHQVSRGNPRMKEYIFGAREGVHIINLEHSEKLLKEASEFVQKLGEEGKIILFVGTKKQAQLLIEEVAKKTNSYYVSTKWIGGLLTNFEEMRKNIRRLKDLAEKREKGQLSRYTKKEQLLISRKLDKFEKEYGGVSTMEKLPDAIFLADCVGEKTALAEAIRLEIPVVGIADSNSNPALLHYPIPGNDDATKSLKILIETIGNFYEEGLRKAGKAAKEALEKKEKEGTEEKVEKKIVAESSKVE